MDCTKAVDACVVDALERSYPELKVGVDRIFDQHGDVGTGSCESVGNLLHGKGVGRSAGAYPEHIHTGFEGLLHMLAGGHFGRGVHTGLLLYGAEPFEAGGADAFKTTRLGARLPYAGAEYSDSVGGQFAGGAEHLFFGFGAAWTGNDQRS